jgi:hypothetical protein
MKVTELRTLLSQRGLSTVGAKQDLVERLATATAGATEEAQEERHAGAFQDSSPTRLDTAAFAMAAAEESTPVDSTKMRMASDGNENVCLDTAATTIAAAEEIRLVGFVASTRAAGKNGTGDGVDTEATQNAAGETGTLRCSERTENSTAVSNPMNLIPIGLDTAAISTAAGETGIGGCAGAAKIFPVADTREQKHTAEYSAEPSAVAGLDIQPISLDTAAISTAAGDTSIGGYKHVVGSFAVTDKDCAPSSVAGSDDGLEHTETTETTVLTPKSSVRAPGGIGEGETSMFATPGDIPPQAFVHLDKFTTALIGMRADFRATLQQAIGALSESINAQLASSFTKIHENTDHIDNRMRSQFEGVNKTVATNYQRLDKRLLVVERDMQTRIQVHDELRADLKETALQLHTEQVALTKSVQSSAQRFTSLKTELSKQLEGVNKHLGELQDDFTQVNATVENLVANQTGASQAMTFARRADEHVNEQGKKFQALDNKLEAQAQLIEQLQIKIIVSNEEVRADIDACKETTHAWDKRLSKFDMALVANESNSLLAFPLASARKNVKREGRRGRRRSVSREGSTVPPSDNDSSGTAASVPFAPRQQAAPMAGRHSPPQTGQSAQPSTTQGDSSSGQAPGDYQNATDDGGYNNTDPGGGGGGWGSSSGPSAFRHSSGEPYCATHEIHESRVRELRFQLDEAEALVKSLRSDSAAERLRCKQMINDMEAELEHCLRDRETDKRVSARALENSERSRAVEIETGLERQQALADENILLKHANEDLRIELNGTIRDREHEEESLSQRQARELALAEENSGLKLENLELKRGNKALISRLQEQDVQLQGELALTEEISELKRDNKALISKLQEGEEQLRQFQSERFNLQQAMQPSDSERNHDGLQEELRQALDQVRQLTEQNKHWESALSCYRKFYNDHDQSNRSGPFPHGPSPIRSAFQDSPAQQRAGPAEVVRCCPTSKEHADNVLKSNGCLHMHDHAANVLKVGGCLDARTHTAREQDMRDKIQQEELSKRHRMLNHIRMRLVDKGIKGGEQIIAEVEDEQTSELNSSEMSPAALLNQSQFIWRVPRTSGQYQYSPNNGSSRMTWEELTSRFFVHVFDSHWSSLAYTSKHGGQELRLTEPIKELKLPPGLEWKGSKTLKTATAEATGVGFFEFLQLIEQFCKEHNIPPTNYERRCAALLLGIQKVHLRAMVLPYVQDIGNYSADGTDKWSELRRSLLHQNAPPHWRHALVTEWLNSLTQGNKQVSNYIAGARHWSTILTMMLPDRQLLPEPLLAMLLAALSHQSIATKLEQFSWAQEKLSETLAVLHLAEARCRPDYNTVKVTKLDHAQAEPEVTAEQPARPEHNTAVMKVLQTLGPQTNLAAVEFLNVLKRLERDEHAVQDWLSPNWTEQEVWPLPHPTQIVASVKMLIAELRKMRWAGTLRDVHERIGVSQTTFDDRMRNRQCTMCGSAEHFFYACPQAQPYKGAFTTAARAGGRQADGGQTRTRQQRYLEPAQGGDHENHPARVQPQERSPNQMARDMHIRAAGNERLKRERWHHNAGGGQAKRAELSYPTERSYEKFQDSDAAGGTWSDDDTFNSASSDDIRTSPQQGGSGNGHRG